jgi:integrase
MPGRPHRVPSYCRHKASGQAVVRINGKDLYLGPYGSPKSRERYGNVLAEHFTAGARSPGLAITSRPDLTIVELIAAYWDFASSYYVKNGKPTSEQESFRQALRPLKKLYSFTRVTDFGPLALEAVRNEMISLGFTRNRINQHVGRIRRMFKWGVSRELVAVTIYQALLTLSGLRRGRSAARESTPVSPVKDGHVEATPPFLPPQLQAMVRLQRLTGCRPGEIVLIRPCDIDRTCDVWEYVPESHKTEHHSRQRRIFIGDKAQAILRPWLWAERKRRIVCIVPANLRKQWNRELLEKFFINSTILESKNFRAIKKERGGSVDGGLAPDRRAVQACGLASDRIRAVRLRQIVVKCKPQGRTTAGRDARRTDAFLVDVPFGGLRANELQGAGGISQRGLDRWLDLLLYAVRHVSIVDRHDGNALVEEQFGSEVRLGILSLVTALPAAAVDVKDDRRGLVGFGLIEIQHLAPMCAVGYV